MPSIEKHEFQAEVKKLLDIVIHSLYTDKEIFIRELISNASDALEKLRHGQITEKEIVGEDLNLEINITTDDKASTFTIQDFGVGMKRDELVKNLGTIAHSDSKAFLEAIKKDGKKNENLIGQFGVGFYSVFMVAKEVNVYTQSWEKGTEGACWTSDGTGAYTLEEATGQRRGCKIVVSLKDEHKSFANAESVKHIIQRYSSFVPFPINLNGERVNTIRALWLQKKSDVKESEYKEFYKFQAHAYDDPRTWLHFNADAPLAINALLFVPDQNPERLGFTGRTEPSVALHCRKVLIEAHPKNLLPEWLRFLKGVVDSADLPLNISRETIQESSLLQKLNRLLTKRFLKHLEELSQKNPQEYEGFWQNFGVFLQEGIVTDPTHREQLGKLLRFESSLNEKGQLTSLSDYTSRMKAEQKDIYYLFGQNRETIEAGPYLEPFKARSIEVIFFYEPIGEFVMNHLAEFEGKKLISGDQKEIDLEDITVDSPEEELPQEAVGGLSAWIKESLGERIDKVETSKRLVDSPAVVLNSGVISASMQRMMRVMSQDAGTPDLPAVTLEINTRHPLIKNLSQQYKSNPDLARLVLDQVFDNTLIAAGLMENPKPMLSRIYTILEKVTQENKGKS